MSDETTQQPSASAPAAEKTAPSLTKTVPAASYSDPKRPHTAGEKKFQRKVHFWLDYIVNSGFSIAWAYTWTEKFGEKKSLMIGPWDASFKNCVEKVGQLLTKIPGMAKDLETQHKYGKTTMELVGLSVVGWLMLFPIKWLKEKELEHVKKVDAKLDAQRGTPLTPKEQEDRAIAYDAIEHRPKQTPGTVIASRIAGLGFNWIGGTLLLKYISDQANKVEAVRNTGWVRHIDQYFSDGARWVSQKKVLSSVLKTEPARTKFVAVAGLVMLELWGCALTAFGLKKAMDWGEKHRGKKVVEARTITVPISGGSTDSVAERKEPSPEPAPAELTAAPSHAARLVAPAGSHREAALREAAGSVTLGV